MTTGKDEPPIGFIKPRHAREIRASRLGVGFECLDRKMFNPDKCYDKVGELGVKHARCQTGWCRCETTRGVYEFGWLDEVVDRLLAQGVQPWFNVGFGNRLYMPGVPHESAVGHVPLYYGPEAVRAWRAYLTALTVHFKDRIQAWEIWNEPNLKGFWAPMPEGRDTDPEAYAELVRISADTIRAEQPAALIIACTSFVPLAFIRAALEAGLGDAIDVLALHPYGAESVAGHVRNVRRLLDRHAPQVRIWQGERGAASKVGGHEDPNQIESVVSEKTQATALLVRTLDDLTTEFEQTSFFHIADFLETPYRQSSGEQLRQPLFGLLNGITYTPKKAYHAYRHLCAVFDDETVPEAFPFTIQCRRDGKEDRMNQALVRTATFRRRGYPLLAYHLAWMPEPVAGLDVGGIWLSDSDQPIEEPVLIDLMDGSVRPLRFTALEWWQSQIFPGNRLIVQLPIRDYPLLITDRRAVELRSPSE